MGFFSWKTSDTNESIANEYTDHCRTVYMLQPNGEPPIKEAAYPGYGEFGGVNAMQWLAEQNFPNVGGLSGDELLQIGIALDCGDVFVDEQTQEVWHVFHDGRKVVPGNYFPGKFDEPIPQLGGMSSNDLKSSGRLKRRAIRDIRRIEFPLKFSFNPDARYEDLPAAETCPDQGYFYSD